MRADLTGSDGSALLLASADEFLPFVSEPYARRWLSSFMDDAANMDTLRRVLAEEVSPTYVDRLSDHEVIGEIARRMVNSCVALLQRDLPWVITDGDAVEGQAEKLKGNALVDEAEEKEPEYEDIKPEPVIPPEFPRMAKRESDAVDMESRKMGFVLDLLRFVGEKIVGLSAIAETLVSMARGMGTGVVEEAGNTGFVLSTLGASPGAKPDPGVLGTTLKQLTGQGADGLINGAQRAAVLIEGMLAGTDAPTPTSTEAGKQLRDASRAQGDKLKEIQAPLGNEMAKLNQGDPPRAPQPTVVGSTFKQAAVEQGKELVDKLADAGEKLDEIKRGQDPDAPPIVGAIGVGALRNAAEQGQALGTIAGVIGDTLDPLSGKAKPAEDKGIEPTAAKPDPLDPGPHWARFQLIDHETEKPYAKVRLKLKIGDEQRTVTTDGKGMVELRDLPANLFDVEGMLSPEAFEVVEVIETVEEDATPAPPEETKPAPVAEETKPAPAPEPKAPEAPRGLLPEEDAWLKDVNRVRKARGLPLKKPSDIPAEITRRAQERAKARKVPDERRREPEKLKAEEQARRQKRDEEKAKQRPNAPPKQRGLLPEEEAWLRDINRVRGARGLPLKTRDDIPADVRRRAERRRAKETGRK
ncbi:MAG: hypothetical protein KC620_20010 [Myxococcales bacterium]|nr:hypothetical protein [Myxococcales bacterium]